MRKLALAQFHQFAGYAPTVLRVMLGIVFAAHGWQKLTQTGPANFAGFLTSLNLPAPDILAWIVTLLELVGGILLILGLATRLVALLFAVEMVGTTLLVKADVGFIAQSAGAELDLRLMAGALAILLLGPGRLALDNRLGLGEPATV